MKELEKAKYNTTIWKKAKGRKSQEDILAQFYRKVCKEHKQTCERWSEWILQKHKEDNIHDYQDKLQDLQETIKFYEERGIE